MDFENGKPLNFRCACHGRSLAQNRPILLANVFQSSRSTLCHINFPNFFAFKEGMGGTPISALLSSPTVSARFCDRLVTPALGPA